jgi:hypothetical protein
MKRTLLALAMGLLCLGNSALADTVVKWHGISAQLPFDIPVGNYGYGYYEPVEAFIWTGGGAATLNLTTGAYQFQVKYLSWAMPITDLQPIGATLDNTIPLRAVFVCDSLGSAFPLGPVPFNLDKTGSANIQGVLMDKSQLPLCADKKDKIAFLIIDEYDNYFVFGTGRQVVTSTQNNQK